MFAAAFQKRCFVGPSTPMARGGGRRQLLAMGEVTHQGNGVRVWEDSHTRVKQTGCSVTNQGGASQPDLWNQSDSWWACLAWLAELARLARLWLCAAVFDSAANLLSLIFLSFFLTILHAKVQLHQISWPLYLHNSCGKASHRLLALALTSLFAWKVQHEEVSWERTTMVTDSLVVILEDKCNFF